MYPFFGIRLSPMIAAAAMALSSPSVVTNANRLRRYRPGSLPPAGRVQAEPQVQTPGGSAEAVRVTAAVTDPVCGTTVDAATAAEHRGTGRGTVYFCSAGCAAAYDEGPVPPAATTANAASASTVR